MDIRFTAFWNFSKLQFVLHILVVRNFYSCDGHHANYGKHSLNNHFQQCAHSVYEIYSVLKLFETAVFSAPLGFYGISTVVMRIMVTMANIVLIIISNIAHAVYIRFKAFWNSLKLQFVLHIFAFTKFLLWWWHHANCGKRSFNHHFQHCAHSVYQIESVLKLFETAVCFAHFCCYEISTPVMGPMETVVNIVQVIISDIGHTV